jgi:hypothetical protein
MSAYDGNPSGKGWNPLKTGQDVLDKLDKMYGVRDLEDKTEGKQMLLGYEGGKSSSSYSSYGGLTKYAPRCYESHKPFKLGKGMVYGGSCSNPVDGCDVYVGLDSYMDSRQRAQYPWETKPLPFVAVHFTIPDMGVPGDTKNFKAMIDWLCNQLHEGKHVHVGCIGGHGRTGMVLSCLVHRMKDIEDSTTWVRKHYCKKAVESKQQVDYLFKHFGIAKVEPAKLFDSLLSGGKRSKSKGGGSLYGHISPGSPTGAFGKATIDPVPSSKSIYGRKA